MQISWKPRSECVGDIPISWHIRHSLLERVNGSPSQLASVQSFRDGLPTHRLLFGIGQNGACSYGSHSNGGVSQRV